MYECGCTRICSDRRSDSAGARLPPAAAGERSARGTRAGRGAGARHHSAAARRAQRGYRSCSRWQLPFACVRSSVSRTTLLSLARRADTSVADVLEANLVWWVLQVLVEHTDNAKLVRNALLVLAAMAALNGA